MAKATITKIDLQNGTTRTVFATWTWSKKSQTEEYDIRWYYATGDGVRFIGSEEKKTITNAQLQSTYTAPENATLVKFQVKPISKTKTVNNKETVYWTAEWSTEAVYNFTSNPAVKPNTPTVTIKDYTLTAKLENIDSASTSIQFQIVKDDSTIYKTGTASVVTAAASYSCSVDAGSTYKVRCRAKNNNGYSEWTDYSTNVSTVTGTPIISSYKAMTETSVYISWYVFGEADTYDIEYANDETYLGASNASTTINGITAQEYTITGLTSGDKYFFRVRAVNEQGESGWSDVVSIVIGSTPAAPTTWSSTTTAIVGEEVILYWVHNAEDGSKEKTAEVQLTINGSTETHTVENTSEDDEEINSIYRLSTSGLAEGATVQWRVRTAGITLEYGDWSIERTINVYAPATLGIEITNDSGNPIDTITSFPFYIEGAAGPSNQTPIGYHVSIVAGTSYETVDEVGNVKMISKGDEVYSKFYDTDVQLLLQLTPGSIDLENNVEYTVNCMVTMDTGLSVTDSTTFKVAWTDEIYYPDAEIGFDSESLTMHIRPYCEDDNGNLVSGITLSVYRRQYDGGFVEIGSDLVNTEATFVTDPHPSLDYARYRIVATSDSTGAISYTDIPGYPTGETSVVIQWAESWSNFDDLGEAPQETPAWSGSMLKLPYNIDVSDSNSVDVTLVKYIGRSHPVSYYGTQIGSTSTWNVDIDKQDKNTLYALRRLAVWMGDVYVREPSGSGYWANVSVSFSQTHCELVIPVTLNITRVEGGI